MRAPDGDGELTEDCLLAEARRETGLADFGDESFRPALRMLLRTVPEDMELNAFGRQALRGRILRSLRNRLWAHACFAAHPEILERRIAAPIVIVGPGRSGTTRLQRMLAMDARLQHLKAWEGFNPAARLALPEHGRQVRRAEVAEFLAKGKASSPGAYTAHPMDTDWPEEEILLINHSFCGVMAMGLHRYHDWLLGYDQSDAYRYMADLMRLISWSRGDPPERRWVLKTPHHMLALDVLLKTFPDARIIFTHRDPLKTVPSTMSLMWHFAHQASDRPLREPIREVWLHMCEEMERRCMRVRESFPAGQQLDVQYEDVNGDWRAVMRRIYDFAGMAFDRQAAEAIGGWLAASASEGRHQGHRYSLADFGITREEVDARFGFVREKYGIPYEGSQGHPVGRGAT